MTPTRKGTRELAERTSSGTLVRLFWRQGTRELWVEVWEPEFDVTIVIPAEPEQALEAFQHPTPTLRRMRHPPGRAARGLTERGHKRRPRSSDDQYRRRAPITSPSRSGRRMSSGCSTSTSTLWAEARARRARQNRQQQTMLSCRAFIWAVLDSDHRPWD